MGGRCIVYIPINQMGYLGFTTVKTKKGTRLDSLSILYILNVLIAQSAF